VTPTILDPEYIPRGKHAAGTPDARVLVAVAAAAVGFDAAVRSGVAGLLGAAFVAAVSLALAWSGRIRNRQAMVAIALAPVFGAFLALRMSMWLIPLDIVVAAGLLAVGVSFAERGSLFDVSIPEVFVRSWDGVLRALAAPAFVAALLPRGRGWAGVVRGGLLATPLILVLGLLLSSADAVFASFFRVLDPGAFTGHLFLWVIGAWGMAALLHVAATERRPVPEARPARLGQTETCTVLGALVGLYGLFALAQVVAASEGGRRVLRTAGLTYADYARQGFFQLVAVAAVTLVVLLALDNGTRVVRLLSQAAVALTLVIVVVALRRLHLYEQAFGLTMLRLFVMAFAVWVGAVFVLLAFRLGGMGGGRHWFAPAAVTIGVAMAFVLNVVDPEAVVVRRNAARPDFDVAYAATLSDDAVPALVKVGAIDAVCDYDWMRFGEGWTAWNRSHRRAEALRAKLCPEPLRFDVVR
jgi:hypothetical protein